MARRKPLRDGPAATFAPQFLPWAPGVRPGRFRWDAEPPPRTRRGIRVGAAGAGGSFGGEDIRVRVVGGPEPEGSAASRRQFPAVEYLGRLSQSELEAEVGTWARFLTRCGGTHGERARSSRKLSRGVCRLLSTPQVLGRGNVWTAGAVEVVETPEAMAILAVKAGRDPVAPLPAGRARPCRGSSIYPRSRRLRRRFVPT